MKKKQIIIYMSLLFVLLVGIKAYYDTNLFKVNQVAFETEKMPNRSSITILQLSDLHNKVFGDQNKKLIKKVEDLNADIIVITGDLIDRKTSDFTDMFALVEELMILNENVYFISGNHEWDNPDTEVFFAGLEELNVSMLDNAHTTITLDNATINLVGIGDSSTEHDNLAAALDGLNPDNYTVLLSHTPDTSNSFIESPVDLTLSGHTHGGQVRLPFIGGVVAPDQGFFPAFDKGIFERGDGKYLYIDSGLGTSILPIRFLNQSQMSMITVHGNN
ncbi:metallophosphoesterase [Paraliobacillus sediminis]|uniref:metallophosphoesterase n=1 Tax=Paraliobacillus sediminis TaxID=1885916 RepID=UPI000E3E25F9|nr:metallophosphoesterase [Paraliobacillus sediminis]